MRMFVVEFINETLCRIFSTLHDMHAFGQEEMALRTFKRMLQQT